MEIVTVTIVRTDGWQEHHEFLRNRVIGDVGDLLDARTLDVHFVQGDDAVIAPGCDVPAHALLPDNPVGSRLTRTRIRGDIALVPKKALR